MSEQKRRSFFLFDSGENVIKKLSSTGTNNTRSSKTSVENHLTKNSSAKSTNTKHSSSSTKKNLTISSNTLHRSNKNSSHSQKKVVSNIPNTGKKGVSNSSSCTNVTDITNAIDNANEEKSNLNTRSIPNDSSTRAHNNNAAKKKARRPPPPTINLDMIYREQQKHEQDIKSPTFDRKKASFNDTYTRDDTKNNKKTDVDMFVEHLDNIISTDNDNGSSLNHVSLKDTTSNLPKNNINNNDGKIANITNTGNEYSPVSPLQLDLQEFNLSSTPLNHTEDDNFTENLLKGHKEQKEMITDENPISNNVTENMTNSTSVSERPNSICDSFSKRSQTISDNNPFKNDFSVTNNLLNEITNHNYIDTNTRNELNDKIYQKEEGQRVLSPKKVNVSNRKSASKLRVVNDSNATFYVHDDDDNDSESSSKEISSALQNGNEHFYVDGSTDNEYGYYYHDDQSDRVSNNTKDSGSILENHRYDVIDDRLTPLKVVNGIISDFSDDEEQDSKFAERNFTPNRQSYLKVVNTEGDAKESSTDSEELDVNSTNENSSFPDSKNASNINLSPSNNNILSTASNNRNSMTPISSSSSRPSSILITNTSTNNRDTISPFPSNNKSITKDTNTSSSLESVSNSVDNNANVGVSSCLSMELKSQSSGTSNNSENNADVTPVTSASTIPHFRLVSSYVEELRLKYYPTSNCLQPPPDLPISLKTKNSLELPQRNIKVRIRTSSKQIGIKHGKAKQKLLTLEAPSEEDELFFPPRSMGDEGMKTSSNNNSNNNGISDHDINGNLFVNGNRPDHTKEFHNFFGNNGMPLTEEEEERLIMNEIPGEEAYDSDDVMAPLRENSGRTRSSIKNSNDLHRVDSTKSYFTRNANRLRSGTLDNTYIPPIGYIPPNKLYSPNEVNDTIKDGNVANSDGNTQNRTRSNTAITKRGNGNGLTDNSDAMSTITNTTAYEYYGSSNGLRIANPDNKRGV